MKRVIVLGATGSIGVQALSVIAASRDLCVVGLSCDRNVTLLLEQAVSLRVNDVAVASERAAAGVPAALYPEIRVRSGPGGAARLVREVEADIVLNASSQSVSVPERCVRADSSGRSYVVVRSKTGDRWFTVEVGVIQKDRIQIRSGLEQGQTVVCRVQ